MLQSQASNIPGGLGAGVAPEWRSDERETLRQGRRSRTSRTGQPPSFFWRGDCQPGPIAFNRHDLRVRFLIAAAHRSSALSPGRPPRRTPGRRRRRGPSCRQWRIKRSRVAGAHPPSAPQPAAAALPASRAASSRASLRISIARRAPCDNSIALSATSRLTSGVVSTRRSPHTV